MLDDDEAFTHPDDLIAAKKVVAHAAAADVADAFHSMFADLARKNQGNKSVKFKTGPKPHPKPKPRFARRDLLRELVCDECGRDYGVFAISLFCPDCGAPNIHLHFAREAELVAKQVELAGEVNADQGELAYRLLGNAHEDVLTAFEATLKTVYLYKLTTRPAGAPEVKPVGNAFQNIERGQKRFAEFDFNPFGSLTSDELSILTLNIQKRHVIGHNLGIADVAFTEHAADSRLGETVPIVGEEILQFAGVCKKIVENIDTWLATGVPPPVHDKANPIIPPATNAPVELQMGELGKLAVRIGLWISERSERGFDDFISEDDLVRAFPESSIDDLVYAVTELAEDGYIQTTIVNSRIPRIQVAVELFIAFDPHTLKEDPALDVVTLVDLVLKKRTPPGSEELHKASGWPLRRFNPAFAYMISQVDERRVVGEGATDYPAVYFHLTDEDRVRLKRFADRLRP